MEANWEAKSAENRKHMRKNRKQKYAEKNVKNRDTRGACRPALHGDGKREKKIPLVMFWFEWCLSRGVYSKGYFSPIRRTP